MSYKISIITINYNDAIGLQKTFKSVFSQSYQEFEYLVIDGNSSDGSKEIILQNAQHIDYWVSEKDNGVYNALNKGIKKATGTYLIFMNSGDTFYNQDVLQQIVPYLDDDISILYGNSAYYNEDIFVRNEFPPSHLTFNYFFNFALNHQATITKRELFEKYFYYNEEYKICADWEFLTYVLCAKNESYRYINEFICNYDLNGISADEKNKKRYESEREQSLKKYFPLMFDDYIALKQLEDKRIRRMLYIKQFPLAWKILKSFSKFVYLFLPRKKEGL